MPSAPNAPAPSRTADARRKSAPRLWGVAPDCTRPSRRRRHAPPTAAPTHLAALGPGELQVRGLPGQAARQHRRHSARHRSRVHSTGRHSSRTTDSHSLPAARVAQNYGVPNSQKPAEPRPPARPPGSQRRVTREGCGAARARACVGAPAVASPSFNHQHSSHPRGAATAGRRAGPPAPRTHARTHAGSHAHALPRAPIGAALRRAPPCPQRPPGGGSTAA